MTIMPGSAVSPSLRDHRLGEHLSCLYRTQEEHRSVLSPLICRGLERGEKVVYMDESANAETVLRYLREEGWNPAPYLETKQLCLSDPHSLCTGENAFDPKAIVDFHEYQKGRALAEGYRGLRTIGDMLWVLRRHAGPDRLMEYEANLDKLVPGTEVLAVCLYDRERFPPDVLLDVIMAHPTVLIADARNKVHEIMTMSAGIDDGDCGHDQIPRSEGTAEAVDPGGGATRDINRLATAIMGYSDVLFTHPELSRLVKEGVQEIRESARKAAGLTRRILSIGRTLVRRPEALDLNAVIVGLRTSLTRSLDEKVSLLTPLDPDLGSVRADRGQMEQVIMNLAFNAVEAMPEGGIMTIGTRNVSIESAHHHGYADVPAGGYVMMTVSDTGHGMDDSVKAHLYEPFFTTKRTGEGAGLGLATVYEIIRENNGSIWASSQPHRGTVFSICLPRVS